MIKNFLHEMKASPAVASYRRMRLLLDKEYIE